MNAWGGAMFAELAAWLPQSGADVLCLQEVTRTPGIVGWTSFEDGERALPQRANLFDDVNALMPRHQGWFVASDAGPVRDREGHVHRQDFGLAVFVDRRIRSITHESPFVHGAFVDHEHWPSSDRPRRAQAIRFVDPTSDGAAARAVTVVHVHGLRDAQGKADTPARRGQADRLAGLVDRARAADDLTIVCGDLNVMPDSETFAVLRAIGLVDLVGRADTRTSHYPKAARHASYLLVSDAVAVEHFEVLAEPEVSDHRALVLDI